MQKIPTSLCPGCKARFDEVIATDPSMILPVPGDFTVCPDCGCILRFDKDMMLTRMTEQDKEDLCPECEVKLMAMSLFFKARKDSMDRIVRHQNN